MNLRITGLDEARQALRGLPDRVKASTATALKAAAELIADEVRARTPEGKTGLLKDSVQVHVEEYPQRVTARIGFSSEPSPEGTPQDAIAMHVEYGHRAGNNGAHVPAHPFVRPAFAASEAEAITLFEKTLKDTL